MKEPTAETKPKQNSQRRADPDLYSELAVWLCENRKTRFKTRIQGTLAQVLKKYPNDYKLRLLLVKEDSHEHAAATG